MDPLKLSKNVNKWGIKVSKQTSSVTVGFAVNIMRTYEGNAVFAILFSWEKRDKFSKMDAKINIRKYFLLNWCLCLIFSHLLKVIQSL